MNNVVNDRQIDPPDDEQPIGYDFEEGELYPGQTVWQDVDGNYIDDDLVTPYFARYLSNMEAKLMLLGD